MKPAGHTAVMADRAPGEVEGDDARTALQRRLELFPTPPWAARAGGELIQAIDPGGWWCWEPACGRGVAILARASFLESASRFALFFGEEARLLALAPFIERVPMVLGGWDPKASTATAYAWFVWLTEPTHRSLRIPPAGERPEIWPIGPGTRARLTRPDDARLWGRRGAAPLLEGFGDA